MGYENRNSIGIYPTKWPIQRPETDFYWIYSNEIDSQTENVSISPNSAKNGAFHVIQLGK
ncbi:hypothetical protein ASG93_08455 [Paenibacillus sp. Soil787]|nr:hypothetical protein ASG93_08455 [Paenibacillus sp. Soil787]